MKITIFSEKDNPYMKRKEVVAHVEHPAGATPSRASLQQELAKEWGVAVEQVDIKSIMTSVGKQSSRLRVHVWQEKKVPDLSKLPKEEKKPEAAPPATAPASAQSAEKKQ